MVQFGVVNPEDAQYVMAPEVAEHMRVQAALEAWRWREVGIHPLVCDFILCPVPLAASLSAEAERGAVALACARWRWQGNKCIYRWFKNRCFNRLWIYSQR